MEFGILWLAVQETEVLRQLHNRLNQELAQRFGNTQANYDGAGLSVSHDGDDGWATR